MDNFGLEEGVCDAHDVVLGHIASHDQVLEQPHQSGDDLRAMCSGHNATEIKQYVRVPCGIFSWC